MKEFEYNGNKYKIKGNGNNFGIINNYGLTEAEVERLVAENTKSLLDEVAKTGNAITQEIVDKVVAYNENKILKTIFQFKEEIKGEIDDLKKLISSDERYNSTIGIPSVGSVKEIKVSSVNPITGAVEIDFPFLKSNPVTLENYDKNEFEIVGTELKKYTGSKTEIVIPQGVTSIGDCAFKDCSLICVEIPSSVNFIGKIAFGCYLLTSITIPDSVTLIDDYAFSGCSSLTSITIPESVTSIGKNAFDSCDSLTIYCEAVEKPNGWDKDWNFYGGTVVWDYKNNDKDENGYAYTVTDGIRYSLKDGIATVVRQPTNIKSATIPEKVTYRGEEYSVTSIDYDVFKECNSLTSITIPNSVNEIYDSLFDNSLFFGCNALTLYCEAPEKPKDWDNDWNRAYNNGLDNSTCPVVWDCKNNDKDENGYAYSVIDGIRYSLKDGEATVVEQPRNIISAVIPEKVTYKGEEYNVTSIGENTFLGCYLITHITIPDSITTIGSYAFNHCSSLKVVSLPKKLKDKLKNIFGEDSFNFFGTPKFKINYI